MSLKRKFEVAELCTPGGQFEPDEKVYLLVTANELRHAICGNDSMPHDTLCVRTAGRNANTMLNDIASWMIQTHALDQRALHGDKREEYSISFYRLGRDAAIPSRFAYFSLGEFVFGDKDVGSAENHDGLMRMLDRDKLGLAMRTALVRDLGLPLDQHEPSTWRQDIRTCGHPDGAAHVLPAPKIAVARPAPVIA